MTIPLQTIAYRTPTGKLATLASGQATERDAESIAWIVLGRAPTGTEVRQIADDIRRLNAPLKRAC
jgi:hypothetical protein